VLAEMVRPLGRFYRTWIMEQSRMMPRIPSVQSVSRNLKSEPMGTPVSVGTRRLSLLSGEVMLFAILLGAAAIIFWSALGEPPADSSQPLVAKFPAELVEAVAFSPDGKTLASCGRDHTIRLWNMEKLGDGRRVKPTIMDHATARMSLAFSPDGKTLVTGGDRSMVIWSYEAGQCMSPRELESNTVRCLAYSPDGRTLALGCDDGSVRLWDMPEARERAVLEAHVDVVRSVSFSPDGRRLVSTSQDRLVMLWDALRGVAIHPLGVDIPGHNPVRFAAFSPDGTYVAVGEVAGSPSEIVLLNAETGALRSRLTGLAAGINALAFSPDGRTLASAGVDSCIKLWDMGDTTGQSTVSNDVGFVKSLAFSRDGVWLAFAGSDDTIKIWDMKHRKSVLVGQARQTERESESDRVGLSHPRATMPGLDVERTGNRELQSLPSL
jgi:WD40 repeat protein